MTLALSQEFIGALVRLWAAAAAAAVEAAAPGSDVGIVFVFCRLAGTKGGGAGVAAHRFDRRLDAATGGLDGCKRVGGSRSSSAAEGGCKLRCKPSRATAVRGLSFSLAWLPISPPAPPPKKKRRIHSRSPPVAACAIFAASRARRAAREAWWRSAAACSTKAFEWQVQQ